MKKFPAAGVAAFLALAWSAAWSAEPAADHRGFSLDEYSVTASRAPDDWQVGAGVTFGDSYRGDYCLFGGGRVSWAKALRSGATSNGFGIGAIGGVAYRPQRAFAPTASLAADWLSGLDGYRYKLTASAGVRVRVVQERDATYAVALELIHATLEGTGGVPNKSGFGIAVVCSVGFLDRS